MEKEKDLKLESRKDTAATLGISLRKLELLIDAQKIPTVRIDKRVLIPRQAIADFIAQRTA